MGFAAVAQVLVLINRAWNTPATSSCLQASGPVASERVNLVTLGPSVAPCWEDPHSHDSSQVRAKGEQSEVVERPGPTTGSVDTGARPQHREKLSKLAVSTSQGLHPRLLPQEEPLWPSLGSHVQPS